jgi:AcrR family transcriptional regulator
VVLAMMPGNLTAIRRRLEADGREVDSLESRGRLVLVEAQPLLDEFMRNGEPDRQRFRRTLGGLVAKARSDGGPIANVRVVGEMVEVLRRQGNDPAVPQIEDLWSELVREQAISLLCAYQMGAAERSEVPHGVAGSHSHVIEDLSSRDRLLRAGRDLFTSVGFQEASTASIARRAGTSESQLIKHFTHKNGLLEAIFEDWWVRVQGEIDDALASDVQPVVKLIQVSDLLLGHLAEDEGLTRLLLFEADRLRRQEPDSMFAIGVSGFESSLDDLLARVGNGRLVELGVSIPAVRAALIGACQGLVRDRLASSERGTAYELAAIRGTLHTLASTLLELDRKIQS